MVATLEDSDIGYFLPDRKNQDDNAHTYGDILDLQLAYDVEGTVV